VAAAPQAPPYGPKAARLNTPLPWTQPEPACCAAIRPFCRSARHPAELPPGLPAGRVHRARPGRRCRPRRAADALGLHIRASPGAQAAAAVRSAPGTPDAALRHPLTHLSARPITTTTVAASEAPPASAPASIAIRSAGGGPRQCRGRPIGSSSQRAHPALRAESGVPDRMGSSLASARANMRWGGAGDPRVTGPRLGDQAHGGVRGAKRRSSCARGRPCGCRPNGRDRAQHRPLCCSATFLGRAPSARVPASVHPALPQRARRRARPGPLWRDAASRTAGTGAVLPRHRRRGGDHRGARRGALG